MKISFFVCTKRKGKPQKEGEREKRSFASLPSHSKRLQVKREKRGKKNVSSKTGFSKKKRERGRKKRREKEKEFSRVVLLVYLLFVYCFATN